MNELTGQNPLVSIIVPSFNQGSFIRETLNSILDQDYRPLEVLVLDGGSTDETREVLKSFSDVSELKWLAETDDGVVDAVNKGLGMAHGDIIGIQSSDDVYLPGAISAAVKFMTEHHDVAIVYGDVEYIDEYSNTLGRDILNPFDLRDYLGRFSYIPQPCAFFRAEKVKTLGGWRQEVSYAADADYWLRIAIRNKVVKLDRLIARYRYHPRQRDTQKAKISRDWEKTVNELLATNNINKSTRRFARMGIYLAKYRYAPESDWMQRTWYLYRAAVANPQAITNPNFPKRELLIGREPLWKFLSHVKKRLGCRPRA